MLLFSSLYGKQQQYVWRVIIFLLFLFSYNLIECVSIYMYYKLLEPLCFVFRRTDVCCMRSPCYFKQICSLIVILVQCILYTCTMYCKCMIFGCSSHFAFFFRGKVASTVSITFINVMCVYKIMNRNVQKTYQSKSRLTCWKSKIVLPIVVTANYMFTVYLSLL